ncbi:Methyltransferase domain-containing protein [Halopenitus malekzadehii]|uniref:Methyltransferase domain-containing protein n=1 Tax=Halopenitus malekzadehii TaxID=1267564 RepID=A0A1H6IA25_9EURY|nr:class I SAM-dependent methyltransferase [Halopenitus malekzadehii]SEH45475.1 Methyltransferase domain-containing protein [Halopenitus malekzadehii]
MTDIDPLVPQLRAEVKNLDPSVRSRFLEYLDVHESYFQGIVAAVTNNIDGRILEVGSVPCHITFLLKEIGYDIKGLDIDPSVIEDFMERNQLEIYQCDVERDKFPAEDNSFDGVIFTEVLEHLHINPIHTFEEIKRVLKPNGKLILTTPNVLSFSNLYSLLTEGIIVDPYEQFMKLEKVGHMGHIREYTAGEVGSLLENTGFTVDSHSYMNWMDKTWSERSLSSNLAILSSKILPIGRFHLFIASL